MDCRTALRKLEAVRPDSEDLNDPELAAAAAHLREHPQCAATFQARQELDRTIGRGMRDVAIPPGLKQRLLDRLESPEPASQPSASPQTLLPARARRRWVVWVPAGAVAACVLAAVLFWLLNHGDGASLTTARLYQLAKEASQADAALPEFEGTFQPRLPDFGWRSGVIHFTSGPQTAPSGAAQNLVAMYRFQVPRRDVQGVLLVAPASSVADPPRIDYFSPHGVSYDGPYSLISWTEGERVYVCLVHGPHDAVERLHKALSSTPAA